MNFKESEIYKEIISSEKTLPIPYYINTGIIINEINVKFIIEIYFCCYEIKHMIRHGFKTMTDKRR